MIQVKDLSHRLGGKLILNHINFCLQKGSVTGLVGINGAGKTTLLRLISGVYTPDEGEILCDGVSMQDASQRSQLFFLPDDPYYTIHTTGENLWEMYRVFYPQMDRAVFQKYMDIFSLSHKAPIRNFSKGMRRQLYVALALAVRPQYLLMDEAFDGLDPLARLSFRRAVNEAVEDFGCGVLISSHSLRELESFCDSYILLDNRTVSSSGDIADHVEAYCKFQLAFADTVEDSLFSHLPVVSLDKSGRFVRVVLEGDSALMATRLQAMSPLVMEEMPMDFEEMFIAQVEKRGYLQ